MATSPTLDANQTAEAAWNGLQRFLTYEAGLDGPDDWSADNYPEGGLNPLDPDGVEIHDLSGNLLYREHSCTLQNGKQVRVAAAAAEATDGAIIKLGISPQPLPIADRVAAIRGDAAGRGITIEEGPQALVCYCYPKLGLKGRTKDGGTCVIDLFEDRIIAIAEGAEGEGGPTIGPPPVPVAGQGDGAGGTPTQAMISGVALQGQETPTYCAVASAKMILDYHEIVKTQDEIALVMQTGPGGTMPAMQLTGYVTLSDNHYIATNTAPATFAGIQGEVNANRPGKSGIPGHARVAAGWKVDPGTAEQQWIYVYDPWPVNQGQVYWEAWNAVVHTNFLSVAPS